MHIVAIELPFVAATGVPCEATLAMLLTIMEMAFKQGSVRPTLCPRPFLNIISPLTCVRRAIAVGVLTITLLSVIGELALIPRTVRENQNALTMFWVAEPLAFIRRTTFERHDLIGSVLI